MRALCLTLWITFFGSSCIYAKVIEKGNPKYAAIVVDAKTGKTLFARHADALRYPASLTKMMTLYMVFEALEKGQLRLFQKLHVSRRATTQQPSKLYLKAGSTITVHDAILALVTKSANDVAVVVAEALGKSEKNFALMMTRKAKHLGLTRTTFGNASGLPNGQRYTTARDMVKLSRALYTHFPQFYHYFSTQEFRYKGNVYRHHNKLIGKVNGCDGLKTGFTNASGYNLAASVQQGHQRIFAVVMGGRSGQSRNQHMRELLAMGIKQANALARFRTPKPVLKPAYFKTIPQKPHFKMIPKKPYKKVSMPLYYAQYVPIPPKPPQHLKSGQRNLAITKQVIHIKQSANQKWIVQVGAFAAANKALKLAQNMQAKVPLLKEAGIVISAADSSKALYQARLHGLTKNQADKACRILKKSGQDCMVLKSK